MPHSTIKADSPEELQRLAESDDLDSLRQSLSLHHNWGIYGSDYVSVLGSLLNHEDTEIQRLTLAVMLNHARYHSCQLEEYLPVLRKLMTTQYLALELVIAVRGPSADLVPIVKNYLIRYPEETCDLIVQFGPVAKDLVPQLIEILQRDDWDEIWAAIDALGAIGPDAADAVPMLERLTRHESGIITGQACEALENITGVLKCEWPRGPRDD